MAAMTILEAAEHFGVSKEAIHNRVRRGSLVVTLIDGAKMVEIDSNAKSTIKPKATTRRATAKSSNDKYYRLLEEQNAQLQSKVDKLEGETRSLRDQKEDMLIQERIKIEQIYKEKDEQLKNILSTISSQFMLNAPVNADNEEHFDAEIEAENEPEESKKGELISLKKYMKRNNFSEKKREKIKNKFLKKAKKDERIIIIGGKFYIDTIKYDYSDLI